MKEDRLQSRGAPRGGRLFLAVSVLQLLISIGLLFYVFGTGMARFDTGAPATRREQAAEWMFAVLQFPLLTLVSRIPGVRFPGFFWGWVPFLANAAVWGLAAVVIRRWGSARASRRPAE